MLARLRSCGAPIWLAPIVAGAIVLSGCATEQGRTMLEFAGVSMGTRWTVKVVTDAKGASAAQRDEIDAAIRQELTTVDGLLSTWKATSELSRFNRSTDLEPFPVSPATFDVFRWSAALSTETDGALDPTLAPLIEAWGFGVNRSARAPDASTLERLRQDVGMALVELDPAGQWVRKRRPGVQCTFSALAPGYAADRIQAQLESRQLRDFLIDVSGELVARGRNGNGLPWQVAIERPNTDGLASRVVPLTDQAISTSGDYRNVREVNGVRLTHILDPRSGQPVQHALASVTVVDDLAVRADGLSTALMVMGPEQGMAYAAQHGLPALFLIRRAGGRFEEQASPAFARLGAPVAAAGTDRAFAP